MEYQPPKADEKVFLLREYDAFAGARLVRYQTIVVVRNDELKELIRPLGFSEDFPGASEVMIYSGLLDSCAEVMDMAENLRFDQGLKAALAERTETSTLYADWIKKQEQLRAFAKANPRTVQQLLRSN